MKDILKYIWFTSHKFGMYITPYLWMYCPDNILIFFQSNVSQDFGKWEITYYP